MSMGMETTEVEDLQCVIVGMQRLIDSQEILLAKYRETDDARAAMVLNYGEAHDKYMAIQHMVRNNENAKDAWDKFLTALAFVLEEHEGIGVTKGSILDLWNQGHDTGRYDPKTDIGKKWGTWT